MRFTALLLTLALITAAALLARGLWQVYAGGRDGRRHRRLWGTSNIALGGGLLIAAYGLVPAAEVFVLATPVVAMAAAGLAIGVDLRVRRIDSARGRAPAPVRVRRTTPTTPRGG